MDIFGNFCTDSFWNINQTWNNDVPDFSLCFQDIILVSLPASIFSCVILISICRLQRPLSHGPLPWTWLNISKMVISIALLLISIIWFGVTIYEKNSGAIVPDSVWLSRFTKIILFVSIFMIMIKHRTCGVTTSYFLSIFWLLFTICAVALQRSSILRYNHSISDRTSNAIFILSNIYYPLVYVQLFLTLFPDKRNFDSLQSTRIMDSVSFYSYITFSWFNRYIYKSTKQLLTVYDLGFLSVRFIANYAYEIFEKNWQFTKLPDALKKKSLVWALMKSFWPWLLLAISCDILCLFIKLTPPLLLDRMLDFVQHDHFVWRGYFYAALIYLVDCLGKSIQNNGIFLFLCCGTQMKSALINSVYRKNLLLSTASRKDYPSGTITNLMSVDIQRLAYFTWHCSVLITAPLRIALVIIILWHYIGPATVTGVVVVVVMFPITFYISRISEKYTVEQMKVKDTRLKLLNEILSGIKILKLYAWELCFSTKISEVRKREMKLIFYSQLCFILTSFVSHCVPLLIAIGSFTVFLLIDSNNVLTPTRAFVSLNLMEQLKFSLFQLPDAISELIQCNISLGRLKKYFATENTDSKIIGNEPDEGYVLTIRKASFAWSNDDIRTLTDIDINIPKRKLVAVIGPVGSGKTSLLSAILGEMYKTSGSVDIKGSLAYVPQQAWILNKTVKNNILMMKPMVEDNYNRILDLSCLRPDLDILPAGDDTEIGEKGVNLSGGQKQRVSLARAVYQDRDIYLLDDTLSAVDVHVRKALFDDVIGNNGLLRKKTRILVTHDISVLHKVDLIISMKNGQIDEIGTYQELLIRRGSFKDFIQEHNTQKNLEENSKENKRMMSRYMSIDSTTSHMSENSSSGECDCKSKNIFNDNMYRLIEDEKMEIGKVSRKVYWNYIKTAGVALTLFGATVFVALAVSETSKNIWLSKWSDDAYLNDTSKTWPGRLEVYAALGASQAFFTFLGSLLIILGTVKASRKYHARMLESLFRSPLSFFDCTPIGRITNRFSSDMDVLDIELADKIYGWIDCLFFVLGALYVITTDAPIFLACLAPLVIVYYIIQKLYLNCFRQIRRLESTTKSPLYSQLLESIQGVSSICAYKVEKDFMRSFEEKLDNHVICYLNSISCNRWLNSFLDIIGSGIVLIATIIIIQNRHNLSIAAIGLMLSYAIGMTNDMRWFVEMSTELEDKSISVERVDEYCHLKSEACWKYPEENLPSNWPLTGEIFFKNYSTRYREDLECVLIDVTLHIKGGEKVGIVGRTGAGKSSITMALFRIIEPVSGTILIDDIDIMTIGLHSLRSKLTIIPQDPVLFTGSLRSNLDPNNEFSDKALWTSLERSHLKEFVSKLDEGLEYEIDEGGGNLSAGQKQLVCLARALLKNTQILILDEATASVDMETDALIQNTIRTAFSTHTVITIAHRLNTVLDYDKIIVLEKGSVIEVGHPASLLRDEESKFYEMAKDAGLT